MKKTALLLAAIVTMYVAMAQDSTARKLDEIVTAYANLGRFNGSVLVARKGDILLQKGYGIRNDSTGTMNDVNTQFQVASVTKQFTATVVLKLVEMKKMRLNDKLSKYYRGFPYGDSITIWNLLTHTSGMRNFTEEDTGIQKTDEQHMVPYLKTLKPDFAPGKDWHYSNSGYVMLAYIIQKVTGISYFQAVRKYIFIPLHMNSSGFDFTRLANDEKAIGYDELNDTVHYRAHIADSSVTLGAGSIYSTVMDMYKWHRGLQVYNIIGKALTEQAYTACPQHNYGFGWQIDSVYGRKMVSHSGAISGFGSNFARIPADDVCIVILSNKGGSTFDAMHITDKLLAVLYNQPYTVPVKRKPVPVSEEILKRYTGTYEVAEMHLVVDVTINDGRLIAQPSRDGHPGPTAVLVGENNRRFYIEADEEAETEFDVDDTGKVKGLTIFQNGTTKYAVKTK
ncbi:MAG TPA: serine hydrolase [Chitinophagaceae bacterium]|nr:serine hydrolase [Chitinophagaceae bacterium]